MAWRFWVTTMTPVMPAVPARWTAMAAAMLLVGFLGGCAQQVDPERQTRVDSWCLGTAGGSPEGLAQCRQFYAGNPRVEPPVLSRLASLSQPSQTPTRSAAPTAQARTEVALLRSGGIFEVPVTINGAIQLGFIVDSGAADVSIPADVVMTLLRTGTLHSTDFLGKERYVLADGSTLSGVVFRIKSLKVGDRVLEDVKGSVAPASGSLLLGQSFLRRFRSWSIDNARGVIVFE
jgi:clan AA aspartic protease (TIGR02281 family)